MQVNIIVNLFYEATHKWPDCNLDEVSFLKNEHRHIFHITAHKEVNHTNRETEIILFKRNILNYLNSVYRNNFGGMSCEDIAIKLLNEFSLSKCVVLEDGENGAEVYL